MIIFVFKVINGNAARDEATAHCDQVEDLNFY